MVVLVAVGLAGCFALTGAASREGGSDDPSVRYEAAEREDAARARGELDLGCTTVAVDALAGGAYDVSGCGAVVRYVCSSGEGQVVCGREGGIRRAAPEPPDESLAETGDGATRNRVREAVSARSEAVLRCRRGQPITLILTVRPDGAVGAIRGPVATPEEEQCIGAALASVRVAGIESTVQVRASFPPSSGTVAGETASEVDAEQYVRASLDASARDILTCVERETVAVRAVVHADGRVELSLSGDLRGSPEEGCIRAALPGLRLPAGSGGRVILHVVRPEAAPRRDPQNPAQWL